MNTDLKHRIITAINGYVPTAVEDFLEDCKEDKTTIKNLALTLKHWANPQGNYYVALDKSALDDNFGYIQKILRQPRTLLNEEKNITGEDEKYILDLMRIKLDKLADDIIKKYGLNDILVVIPADINEWWQKKSELEQRKIENRYNKLPVEQRKLIAQNSVYTDDVFLYFMMSHYSTRYCYADDAFLSHYHSYDDYDHHQGPFFDVSLCCPTHHDHDSHDKDDKDNTKGKVMAILALIALGFVGFIGAGYALYETTVSIGKFFIGEKIASAFRLSAIGGGAYGGVLLGMIVGAALGSAIPGLGTAAGAVLGAVFCSGLISGIAALISKPIAKWINNTVIDIESRNDTHLTDAQTKHLKGQGYNLKTIEHMLRAIKKEKDNSNDYGYKRELSKLVDKIKSGKMSGSVKIGQRLYNPNFYHIEASLSLQSSSAAYMRSGIQFRPTAPFDRDAMPESYFSLNSRKNSHTPPSPAFEDDPAYGVVVRPW